MAGLIELFVNERPRRVAAGTRLVELAARHCAKADLFIVNGYPVGPDTEPAAGDHCWILQRGAIPTADEMQDFLHARHTPGVQERIRRSRVGIMGLGGLGSVVAMALARVGVGSLLLADFDVVDPTNLNRQQYFIEQIGLPKTEAMRENLRRINPYVEVVTIQQRLTEEDIPRLFAGVDALAECFDEPAMKAAGLRAALTGLPQVYYVTASGLAGFGDNNAIRTSRLTGRAYLVGDQVSEARPGVGLMAPRVGIAAHHQANQILRLLLGEED